MRSNLILKKKKIPRKKKKKDVRLKRQGRHGAANMKGMGSGDMKIAQQALSRSEAKKGRVAGKASRGKRRKGR